MNNEFDNLTDGDKQADDSAAHFLGQETDPATPVAQPQTSPTDEKVESANVQLAPSRSEDALPEGLVNIGMVSIEIPDAEAQAAGFYAKDAGVLVAQFPQYKFIAVKGDRNVPSITI